MTSLQQIQPNSHRTPLTNDDAAVVARRATSAATDSDPAGAAATIGGGTVRAMYGAMVQDLPIAGLTVSEAYERLREGMHMAENVIAVIDGRPANIHERVTSGSTLEFVKRSGEKGVLFS